jgi:hypothetical protein
MAPRQMAGERRRISTQGINTDGARGPTSGRPPTSPGRVVLLRGGEGD